MSGLALVLLLAGCGGGAKKPPVQVRVLEDDPQLPPEYLERPVRYIIGPGDQLRISFLGEEVLNNNMNVTPDGYINVPLLDEPLLAAGLDLSELHDVIVEKLSRLLKNPQIYLNVNDMGSQHVFVLGHVTVPQMASTEPLTLASVISVCGGIKRDGQRKQVIVVRRNPGGDPIVFEVNFMELLKGNSLMPDIPLQRYDIVIVPKSRVANVRDFVQATVGNVIAPPLDAAVDWLILKNNLTVVPD
jgi:polysaccharide export outer membrane protein